MFSELCDALETIGNSHQRHGSAAQSTVIQFQQDVACDHQFAESAKLEAERRAGDVDIRSSLGNVRMSGSGRINGAVHSVRIRRARAISIVLVGLRGEFRSTEQALSINIKCSRQALGENNVSSHNVEESIGK